MSNPNAFATLSSALATRLKMQLALTGLTVVPESMDEDLDRWLESVPLPPDFADGQDAEFGVALTSDLGQITWSASGHPGGFIPKMAAYFADVGISPVDIASLNEAGEDVRPARVGSWVRIRAGTMDRGWYFPVQMELQRARSHAQSSEPNQQLGEWAARHQVEVCSRFGRSIGKDRFTEIVVPLVGLSPADQLRAATAALKSFGTPALPDKAFNALRDAETDKLQVAVWLADTGVTKAAVQVIAPAASLVRELSQSATEEQARMVTQFEGILEVDGPTLIECHYFGADYGLELNYAPRISGTAAAARKKKEAKDLPS